jgi:hypothetical protein
MTEALAQDDEFTSLEGDTWKWRAAPDGAELWVNVSDTKLWTDGGRGWTAERSLAKLQQIASRLDADVVGEEGELLNDVVTPAGPGTPAGFTGGAIAAILFLPFVVLLALVRLPWILWKISRKK